MWAAHGGMKGIGEISGRKTWTDGNVTGFRCTHTTELGCVPVTSHLRSVRVPRGTQPRRTVLRADGGLSPSTHAAAPGLGRGVPGETVAAFVAVWGPGA